MDEDQIRSILDRASDLLDAGKPAKALRCLEPIEDTLLDSEDRIECETLAAWALTEIGRIDDALERLEPQLDEHPGSAKLHVALGVVLTEADDLDAAREVLETAVSLDESDDAAVSNLALVYEKLRDYERAVETYDRALELGADIDWVLQRRAAAQNDAGDYAGAKATLRRYLSLVPDDATQWITLAILCSDDEDYGLADECYVRAETLEPDSPWLRLNWGVTATRARELQKARRQLEQLERIAPNSSRALLLEAFILEEEQKLTEAEACYDRALERVDAEDRPERLYALEMAMDFFTRQNAPKRFEPLLNQAYAENACTVELCEAYREATGRQLEKGTWYSLVIEAEYREGLLAVPERGTVQNRHAAAGKPNADSEYTRFVRNFQVVAPDRDDATAAVQDFARRMGEKHVRIREFVNEEAVEDTFTGIYEVEAESLVFRADR